MQPGGHNSRSFARRFALAAAILCLAAFACAAERLPRTNLLCYAHSDGSIAPVKTTADWQKRRAQILAGMEKIMGPMPGKEKRVPLDVRRGRGTS